MSEGTSEVVPDFSVVVTCHFEEASIDEFYTRLSKTLRSLGRPYEIVMVNDGSTDGTWQKLLGFQRSDAHVTTVVDLYRNAGQAAAMTAGLVHARGRALVFIDSDLQLDPEDLPSLVAEYDKGAHVVSAVRRERRDPWQRRLVSRAGAFVMRRVARHPLTDFGCTFKIYDAALVRAFEFGPFKVWRTAYVFARAGRCVEVPVSHHPRRYGESGWTFRRLLAFWTDHLVGVSERPFQFISLVCLLLAGLFGIRMVSSLVWDVSVLPQVTAGMLLNAIVLSMLATLGVLAGIGEYVIRNFYTLQRYPAYVVREVRTHGEGAGSAGPAGVPDR